MAQEIRGGFLKPKDRTSDQSVKVAPAQRRRLQEAGRCSTEAGPGRPRSFNPQQDPLLQAALWQRRFARRRLDRLAIRTHMWPNRTSVQLMCSGFLEGVDRLWPRLCFDWFWFFIYETLLGFSSLQGPGSVFPYKYWIVWKHQNVYCIKISKDFIILQFVEWKTVVHLSCNVLLKKTMLFDWLISSSYTWHWQSAHMQPLY